MSISRFAENAIIRDISFAALHDIYFVIFGFADFWLPPIFNCASRAIFKTMSINQYREASIAEGKYREVKRSKYHEVQRSKYQINKLNMRLKKLLLAIVLMAIFTSKLSAQEYNLAVGLRLGYDSGISARYFFMPHNAVEGILSFSPNAFKITGLYQFQMPFLSVDNLDWFVGIGAHIGSVTRYFQQRKNLDHAFLFGADLIGGIEYVFPTAPFAISLDWKPSFSFTNTHANDFWFYGFGLSIRYTFGR